MEHYALDLAILQGRFQGEPRRTRNLRFLPPCSGCSQLPTGQLSWRLFQVESNPFVVSLYPYKLFHLFEGSLSPPLSLSRTTSEFLPCLFRCFKACGAKTTTPCTMAIRKRFINPFADKLSSKDQSAADTDIETPTDQKSPSEKLQETDRSSSDDEIVDQNAQSGTQKAQASTRAWTKKTLIAAYIL